jgi:signal transduction histidine kinase/CheY-like chemotaxis protein
MLRLLTYVILPSLFVSAISLAIFLDRQRESTEFNGNRFAESAAESFARQVDIWRTAMDAVLSGNAVQAEFDLDALAASVERVTDRLGGWGVLTTRDDPSVMLFNTLRPGARNIQVARAVPEIVALMKVLEPGEDASLSNVFAGPVAGAKVVAMVKTFRAADGRDYVLSFAFNVDVLQGVLAQQSVSQRGNAALLDSAFQVVTRTGGPAFLDLTQLPEPVIKDVIDRRSATHLNISAPDIQSGEPAMLSHSPIRGTDWSLMMLRPVEFVSLNIFASLFLYGTTPLALILFGGFDRILRLREARQEVERRLQAERESAARLAAALQRAEEAEKGRRHVLGVLGHEIRTPVLGALAALDVMLEKLQGSTDTTSLRSARQGLDVLLSLVDDMLDTARLNTNRLTITNRPLDPVGLVREVAEIIEPLAVGKGLALSLDLPLDDLSVMGDRQRLRQILINLASNAVKYTSSGEIRLGLEMTGRRNDLVDLEFSVSDTGRGISSLEAARIFSPFQRGDGAFEDGIAGLGLGLSISRQLVERMNGKLWVETGPVRGSVFHCSLTLKTADAPVLPVVLSEATRSPKALRGLSLLLVEDQPLQAELLLRKFSAVGVEVWHAATGAEAIKAISDHRPDVVLIDLGLPDMTGIELARRLAAAGSPTIRIAFSANPDSISDPKDKALFQSAAVKSGEFRTITNVILEAWFSHQAEAKQVGEGQ